MNENEFLIELQAKLDEAKSKGNVNSDIDKIQSQIDKLKIQAEIDPKAISNLVKQLENVLNQKINVSNIKIDANEIIKSGQQAGKQFADSVSQGFNNSNNILKNFKESLKNIGLEYDKVESIAKRINNLGVQIKSLNQSKSHISKNDILSVDISGIDQLGQAIKLTEQYDMSTGKLIKSIDAISTIQQKAGSATDSFIEKQKKAVASAKNTLSSIESKLNDPNTAKSLAGTDFDANGLAKHLGQAKSAISNLGNATKETFSQSQIDVDREITELNNLITTLKNAKYAATSLRTKDISTIKIDEENKLDTFVQKMEQSGHYTDDLKNKVALLKNDLSNVFDTATLTIYLNSLSNLQSEFQKVDAVAKTTEKSTKLNANVEAEKKVLQVYTNELKNAGILTGEVKEKIQKMFYSLSKVDSQNGLTTWRAELKGVKAEIDAVLKSTIQEKVETEKLINKMSAVRKKQKKFVKQKKNASRKHKIKQLTRHLKMNINNSKNSLTK